MKYSRSIYKTVFLCGVLFLAAGCIKVQPEAFFYVDAILGNDAWSGTLPEPNAENTDGPWRSTGQVNTYAKSTGFPDNSHICFKRGSRWESGETIGNDGAAIDWGAKKNITIEDYGTGNKPVFDGDGFSPIKIDDFDSISFVVKNLRIEGLNAQDIDYVISFRGLENITLDGVDMDGHANSPGTAKVTLAGIFRIRNKIILRNCDMRNAFYKPEGIGYYRNTTRQDQTIIYMSYAVGSAPTGGNISGTLLVEDCTFSNAESDLLQLKGFNTHGHVIRRCKMSNYGENFVDFKNGAGTVEYCDISQGDVPWGGSGGAGADIVTHYHPTNYGGKPDGMIVRYNYFHGHGNRGITSANTDNLEMYGNVFENVARMAIVGNGCNNVKIYNNIYVNREGVSAVQESDPYIFRYSGDESSNCKLFSNSFYVANGTNLSRMIFFEGADTQTGNEIKGNIFQSDDDGLVLLYGTGSNPPVVSDNIWYSKAGTWIDFNGSSYGPKDQDSWRLAGHINGTFSDPKYKGPSNGDLSLQAGSPAIDFYSGAGVGYRKAIDWLNSDYHRVPLKVTTSDQDSCGTAWEAGAVVYKYAAGGSSAREEVFRQDSGNEGFLCMEAEHFFQNSPKSGSEWVVITKPAGAGNDTAMVTTPNNGRQLLLDSLDFSPRLDYKANFVKTGIHYIWLRINSFNSGDENSWHVGLDSKGVSTSDNFNHKPVSYDWDWVNATKDGPRATIDINTAGEHTVNIFMREDGAAIDKILFTTDAGYSPVGTGPDESLSGRGAR